MMTIVHITVSLHIDTNDEEKVTDVLEQMDYGFTEGQGDPKILKVEIIDTETKYVL